MTNTRRATTIVSALKNGNRETAGAREAPAGSLKQPYGPSSLSQKALPFTLHPELRLGLYPKQRYRRMRGDWPDP